MLDFSCVSYRRFPLTNSNQLPSDAVTSSYCPPALACPHKQHTQPSLCSKSTDATSMQVDEKNQLAWPRPISGRRRLAETRVAHPRLELEAGTGPLARL